MAGRFHEEMDAGMPVPVTVHFWLGKEPCSYTLNSRTGLETNEHGWKVTRGGRWIGSRWTSVYMVETERTRWFNHRRLYDLPIRLAKALAAELPEARSREEYELCGAVARALQGRPWGFSRTFYTPMNWENPRRIADTAARLRDDDWGPADYYIAPRAAPGRCTAEETAAFLAAEREQLGVDRIAGTVIDPRAQ